MTLSIVLFLRALFFVALVTSLAAGNPIPTTEENSFEGFKPINEEKEFLLGAEGWTRLPPPEGAPKPHPSYNPGPEPIKMYFEIAKGWLGTTKLMVRFVHREDKKPGPSREVSRLWNEQIFYFQTIARYWSRPGSEDEIQIKYRGRQLYVKRLKPLVTEAEKPQSWLDRLRRKGKDKKDKDKNKDNDKETTAN